MRDFKPTSLTFVLGNGFDLDLGLKTKYSDFANTSAWPFKDVDLANHDANSLYSYMYHYREEHRTNDGGILWIDVEAALADYAKSKNGKTIDEAILSDDMLQFFYLKSLFHVYLSQKAAYIPRTEKTLTTTAYKFLSLISNSYLQSHGFTFNYTDSTKLFQILGEYKGEITHLHGRLDQISNSVVDGPIILGISDKISVPKEYRFLRKSRHELFQSHDLNDDLCNSDICCFFGVSMGEIDRIYFERFFKGTITSHTSTTPKKSVWFFTKDEYSRLFIIDNLESFGVDLSDYKSCMDIHFIKTEDLEFDTPSKQEFQIFENILLKHNDD